MSDLKRFKRIWDELHTNHRQLKTRDVRWFLEEIEKADTMSKVEEIRMTRVEFGNLLDTVLKSAREVLTKKGVCSCQPGDGKESA